MQYNTQFVKIQSLCCNWEILELLLWISCFFFIKR